MMRTLLAKNPAGINSPHSDLQGRDTNRDSHMNLRNGDFKDCTAESNLLPRVCQRPSAKPSGGRCPHLKRSGNRPMGKANGFIHPEHFTTFAFWNAGGYTKEKATMLQQKLSTQNVDAFCVIDAGSAADDTNACKRKTPGYVMYNLPRGDKKKGAGIIVGAKEGLNVKFQIVKQRETKKDGEIVRLEVWKNYQKTDFLCVYNPPSCDPSYLEQLTITKNTVLVGDFNAHNELWGYEDTQPAGQFLEDFHHRSNLILIDPEGNTKTEKDTYLHYNGNTTRPDLCFSHANIATQITQHNHYHSHDLDHKILIISRISIATNTLETPYRFNFQKAKWDAYTTELENTLVEDLVTSDVDKSFTAMLAVIHTAVKHHIPRGRRKNYKPFWNNNLQKLLTDRNTALLEAQNETDQALKTQKMQAVKKSNQKLRQAIGEAKRLAFIKFANSLNNITGAQAHQKFSKICGKNANRPVPHNEPLEYNNKTYVTDKGKAKAITKYQAAAANVKHQKLDLPKMKFITSDDPYNSIFTAQELNCAIMKLQNKKSPGPDKIHPEFIKHFGPQARTTLLKLMNLAFTTSIPSLWGKAEIIPILKKGKNRMDPGSYRPIVLTSVVAKVAEHMINSRLKTYIESNNLLTEHQAGFRAHRSTIDQVVHFTQHVREQFDKGNNTLAVLIDFKDAFGSVWRQKLLEKMLGLQIPSNLIRWTKNFLQNRYVRTRWHTTTSSFKHTTSGLPQGTVTSPMLFNIMINDLPDIIKDKKDMHVKLFADDVIIWTSGKNPKTLEKRMNNVLEAVNDWTNHNDLTVSTEKTVYDYYTMAKTERRKMPPLQLRINNSILCKADNPTYLGVTLDTKLTGKAHFQKAAEKGCRKLSLLKQIASTKYGANKETLSLIYRTYIRPVLEYGMEAFTHASTTVTQILNKIQNQALRIITGGVKTTPITAMEVYTRMEPLQMRRDTAALILHERIRRVHPNWNTSHTAKHRTYKTFKENVSDIATKHSINIHNMTREPFTTPQLINTPLDIPTTLHVEGIATTKTYYTDSELKALTTRHIHNKYNIKDWTHIYTDGSATPGEGNAGAGVYCRDFEIAVPAGRYGSNFDGEVEAILQAAQRINIELSQPKKLVFLIDSQSAIQAISNANTQDIRIVKVRHEIAMLQKRGCHVVLQWIPSHCGLLGNEKADYLAKMGSRKTQESLPLSYTSVKNYIKNTMKSQTIKNTLNQLGQKTWRDEVVKLSKSRKVNRAQEVANFRLATGHDVLGKHLHRIGVLPNDICGLCDGGVQDRAHLLTCSALQDKLSDNDRNKSRYEKESVLYWLARHLMA